MMMMMMMIMSKSILCRIGPKAWTGRRWDGAGTAQERIVEEVGRGHVSKIMLSISGENVWR